MLSLFRHGEEDPIEPSEAETEAVATLMRNDSSGHLSLQSAAGSFNRSLGSLEVPGAFLFSGPALRSASDSVDHSTASVTDVRTLDSSIARVENLGVHSVECSQSLAHGLPTEIVQQIYSYLGPVDFNAARHTCRTFMAASLDQHVLMTMVRRGGWSSAVNSSLAKVPDTTTAAEMWVLSQRVSRECALSANWVGNGLEESEYDIGNGQRRRLPVNPFRKAAEVDFANLASGYAGPDIRHNGSLVFRASICGQYLMVAEGGMIYIYESCGNDLQALTSVVCPRTVLAMSMDASSRNFTVAALLEGRMGLVVDLDLGLRRPTNDGHRCGNGPETTSSSHEVGFNAVDIRNDTQRVGIAGVANERRHERNLINSTWNLRLRGTRCVPATCTAQRCIHKPGGMPVETGPRSIYRHLCSDDDPPVSVSICPRRRCVAFGCSSGVELHWIDAVSGQDLNRWFPLAQSSDHLFFLSPRFGLDSATKLRLISSATYPDLRHPCYLTRHRGFLRCGQRVSGTLNFEQRPAWYLTPRSSLSRAGLFTTRHASRPVRCDHFYAVPLSDGFHIIFTDPQGDLYLGCDAPLGAPARLIKNFHLVHPQKGSLAILYTAAADLTEGARIVVGYTDGSVVLFSVPPDALAASQGEPAAETEVGDVGEVPVVPRLHLQNKWVRWHTAAAEPAASLSIWPVAIEGVHIGQVDELCELSIHSEPRLTIWALSTDGRATTWQLHDGSRQETTTKRVVGRDGRVCDPQEVDADGDVQMIDAETQSERSVGFDGNDSTLLRISGALNIQNDEYVGFLPIARNASAWYDEDGDVLMMDGDLTGSNTA